jgi:hypothetical protein
MVKMDSKVFDLDRYHKMNLFMSKEALNLPERPDTLVFDHGKASSDQSETKVDQ